MLSIPRDSRVRIRDRGLDKINHAYAFGGIPLTLDTIAVNFGIPIHHWIKLDLPGLAGLLEAVGAVTVNVPRALELDDGTRLDAGPHRMDSGMALLYLIERRHDPAGDFGRLDRAQRFLVDLARHVMTRTPVSRLPAAYTAFREFVDTDMTLREALAIARAIGKMDLSAVQKGMVRGEGVMLHGVYFYEIDWVATRQVLVGLGLAERPPVGVRGANER